MKVLVAVLMALLAGIGWAADNAPSPHSAAPKVDVGQMHAGIARAAVVGDVKVPKATGPDARTVAEIIEKKAALNSKPVLVRGKVVKYTPGVMGKNWIHLQDGSGSAADSTNDVLVTTKDETKIGAVVVARGTVRTDVDLGSGYFYKVLVDEAKLQQ